LKNSQDRASDRNSPEFVTQTENNRKSIKDKKKKVKGPAGFVLEKKESFFELRFLTFLRTSFQLR
jgi:hypothetical protein